jgi:translation initiation factor IF-1
MNSKFELETPSITTNILFQLKVNMPSKPQYGKAKRSALRNNEIRTKDAVIDDTALFGRTVKSLGNKRFRIQVPDKDGRGSEAEAVVGGKSVVRIQIGDVVIVGRNESAGKISYEILGSCDKKTVKQLRDTKRLHESLFNGEDTLGEDIFDRSEEAAPAEENQTGKMNKPVKKMKVVVDEEEDVNVDAI